MASQSKSRRRHPLLRPINTTVARLAYAGRADGLIDEDTPLAPRNAYAATKAAADQALGAMVW